MRLGGSQYPGSPNQGHRMGMGSGDRLQAWKRGADRRVRPLKEDHASDGGAGGTSAEKWSSVDLKVMDLRLPS